MTEEEYKKLRDKYLPKNLKIIFIPESPPANGTFFYKESGRITENLFSAMMKLIGCRLTLNSKIAGLRKFSESGFFIVDAIYSPVNRVESERQRNELIKNNLPKLIADLENIIGKRKVKIILVKANICRILEEPLKKKFEVTNKGVIVPFPGSGHQKEFQEKMREIFNANGIEID